MEDPAVRSVLGGSHLDHHFRGTRAPRTNPIALARRLAPLLCSIALLGCVERRMTIRTNVDSQGGALAIVDNKEIGPTPVSTGFTYYAPCEVRLIRDGYETVTLIQPVPAPWWDSVPLEFFVENLVPFTLRDEREFHYELPPASTVTPDELLGRAQALRTEGQLAADPVPPGKPSARKDKLTF